MDAFSGVTEFVRVRAAKVHDQKFLYHLMMSADSWIVFDKAYTACQYYGIAYVLSGYLGYGLIGFETSSADMADFLLSQVTNTTYIRQVPAISS